MEWFPGKVSSVISAAQHVQSAEAAAGTASVAEDEAISTMLEKDTVHPAIVTAERTFDVAYDDGDVELFVSPALIRRVLLADVGTSATLKDTVAAPEATEVLRDTMSDVLLDSVQHVNVSSALPPPSGDASKDVPPAETTDAGARGGECHDYCWQADNARMEHSTQVR